MTRFEIIKQMLDSYDYSNKPYYSYYIDKCVDYEFDGSNYKIHKDDVGKVQGIVDYILSCNAGKSDDHDNGNMQRD